MPAERTLLVDVGNTRIKASMASALESAPFVWAHRDPDWPLRLDAWLQQQMPVSKAAVASVAEPEIFQQLAQQLKKAHIAVSRFLSVDRSCGVRNSYAQADAFGADRMLGLIAVHALIKGPALLVSVGSALCLDLIDSDGTHLGGLISSTPEHQQATLAQRFQQLNVEPAQTPAWAKSTADAVTAGTLFSAADLINCSLIRAERDLQQPVSLCMSGGAASALRAFVGPHQFFEHIVLQGLRVWAKSG